MVSNNFIQISDCSKKMFSRLKEAISKNVEDDPEGPRKRTPDISFLNPKEIEEYRQTTTNIRQSFEQMMTIIQDNKEDVKLFVKQQKEKKKQQKKEEDSEVQYTFEEDLQEVKTLLSDVIMNISKLQQSNEEIKDRVRSMGAAETPEKIRELHDLIKKYEQELKSKSASQQNSKDILQTLKQQTQLLSKETKDLQQKCIRLEKQLSEKTSLLINLQEQKKVLLQLRNNESDKVNPEIVLLKNQLQQAEKRIAIQKTKLQQKQKQIENLKKKMEEDRDSLQKIADELKEKELKSKKILDKYERSKTEIRKYREEKTEFIKKLNLQIANLTDKTQKLEVENNQFKEQLTKSVQKIQALEAQLSKNEGKDVDLESTREEVKLLRQEQIDMTNKIEEKEQENAQLRNHVDQLQGKRKSLLQALEKPINHEIKTLDKIIRALQKLYKEYIEVVFTQGNIIGFQNKISYILSNVVQIKEDLKL